MILNRMLRLQCTICSHVEDMTFALDAPPNLNGHFIPQICSACGAAAAEPQTPVWRLSEADRRLLRACRITAA